jgi:Family of unknown function (DUF6152)
MRLGSKWIRLGTIAGLMALPSLSAFAHHSYAMFDRQKTETYQAVVRTWEFTNPHTYLWVYINDTDGTAQLWGLEAPGPSVLIRHGWDKNTVKPGDKVTLQINPLLDGRKGGNLIKLTAPDGRTLDAGPLPGAAGNPVLNGGPER